MRYLPLTQADRAQMLAKIGARDIDALFRDVPKAAVVPLSAFDLPDHQGELESSARWRNWRRTMSRRGRDRPSAARGPTGITFRPRSIT